jgi:hypothetical protein
MLRSSSHPLYFPSVFSEMACFRRQFLRKMWPINLAFLHFIVCRMFLFSLTPCNACSFCTQSVELIFSILQHHISKFKGISVHFPKFLIFSALQSFAPNVAFHCCVPLSQIQAVHLTDRVMYKKYKAVLSCHTYLELYNTFTPFNKAPLNVCCSVKRSQAMNWRLLW